jgi:DNA polymerase delta subunit 2
LNALCFDSKEEQEQEPVYRTPSNYNPRLTFHLPAGAGRHYQQQYDDMYFLRLAKLKPTVEQVATDAWDGLTVRAPGPRKYFALSYGRS